MFPKITGSLAPLNYRFDGAWLEMGGHEAGRPADTRGVSHRYVAMVACTSWLYVVMPAARPKGC